MDRIQDLRHRWQIALERRNLSNLSQENILEDVDFLLKRLTELERDLADALNPVSSRMGSLVELIDGILYYRLNGMLVPVHAIVNALLFLAKSEDKLTKGMKAEREEIFNMLKDVFKGEI